MKPFATKKYKGWNISYWMKPVPSRMHDWEATHQDYDPPDDRHITARSLKEIQTEIDEWEKQ